MEDLSVFVGDIRFNFRVAMMIENGDKVLLHKNDKFTYWLMPGGRVKCGEDTLTAVKREIEEELGLEVKEPKLIGIYENFYDYSEYSNHELLFVYKCKSDDEVLNNKQDFRCNDNKNLLFHWFDKKDVKNFDFAPMETLPLITEEFEGIQHAIIGTKKIPRGV